MNDKQFAALFVSELLPRVQAQPGLAGVVLARKYQPRQHGAATGPVVYFFKVSDHNHGAPQRQDLAGTCLLYTSPSPRDGLLSRMPSSA